MCAITRWLLTEGCVRTRRRHEKQGMTARAEWMMKTMSNEGVGQYRWDATMRDGVFEQTPRRWFAWREMLNGRFRKSSRHIPGERIVSNCVLESARLFLVTWSFGAIRTFEGNETKLIVARHGYKRNIAERRLAEECAQMLGKVGIRKLQCDGCTRWRCGRALIKEEWGVLGGQSVNIRSMKPV